MNMPSRLEVSLVDSCCYISETSQCSCVFMQTTIYNKCTYEPDSKEAIVCYEICYAQVRSVKFASVDWNLPI